MRAVSHLLLATVAAVSLSAVCSAAPSPEGRTIHWGEVPVEVLSDTRSQMCLNGLWQFMPATGPARDEPSGDWGWLAVPGSWKRRYDLPGIAVKGEGGSWEDFDGRTVARGWYQRELTIPADWAGRAILLDLTRVSTDAVVLISGRRVGRVSWPGGVVDITGEVSPGETAMLRVLVAATPQEDAVDAILSGEQTTAEGLESRGIIGNVFLRSRPSGAHITDVFVKPSVRSDQLAVQFELAEVGEAGQVAVTASLLDEAGREEERFTATADVAAEALQTVEVTWEWDDPRLWGLRQPNLYTLQLHVEGAGLEDEYSQEFGFREFWIEGRRFFLNGREIRLRPINVSDSWNSAAWVVEAIDGMIDAYLWAGFTLGEQWPWDHGERGKVQFRELWLDRGDRRGFLMAGCALSMKEYMRDEHWSFAWDERKGEWEEAMAAELRTMRNHPSAVMWATTANFFGARQDQNPRLIGRAGWMQDPNWQQRAEAGMEGVSIIKQHDPTRPVFTHHGAYVGDFQTTNNYLCMTPLQEREEWLSDWAENGEFCFLPIEFGTPLSPTMLRGRLGYGDAMRSEPLMTEFCAIYLGSEAYELEQDDYRERMVEAFNGEQNYDTWHGRSELDGAPAFQRLQELFVRNTWRSWRTWGITGGMVPWGLAHGFDEDRDVYREPVTLDFEPGRRGPFFTHIQQGRLSGIRPGAGTEVRPAGETLMEVNGPTLAWIAGSREAFTEKDHHFYPGDDFDKQIVLINDAREALEFSARWQVVIGDEEFASGDESGRVQPASDVRLRIPVFSAPAVTTKTDGEIRLEATIGEQEHSDTFAFRVYPEPPTSDQSVRIFDPEGDTSKLLTRVGVETVAWDGASAPGEVLVIGRRAMEADTQPPGSVRQFVLDGGRVVLFAQSPDWFRDAMGMRVCPQVSRRFYPVPTRTDNPVVAGLDAADLRDWRGAGTLVEQFWGGQEDAPNQTPQHGWHWGNRGSVSSAAIEKPHHAGWRPLLEGEFDLAWTPLMELDAGLGRLIVCTLDLADRGKLEPVADLLVTRLIDYASDAEVIPRVPKVAWLGDAAGAAHFEAMGLRFERADALPEPPALAVIGSDHDVDDAALRAFLQAGGRAVLMPRESGDLPLGLQAQTGTAGIPEGVPDWPEARGLSLSDLRLRADVEAPLLTGEAAGPNGILGRVEIGDGVAIAMQLAPWDLGADERTYLRYSEWRLTRTLAQILTNLGAAFTMDQLGLELGWAQQWAPIELDGQWRCRVERRLPEVATTDDRQEDAGIAEEARQWAEPEYDDSDWEQCHLPAYWESFGENWQINGAAWFRREVSIPEVWRGKDVILHLGNVDDDDVTYFDGERIGSRSGWNVEREYRVPGRLITPGTHTIAIRVFDNFGGGGFGARPGEMRLVLTPPPPPVGVSMLENTDFFSGTNNWNFSSFGTSEATIEITEDVPEDLQGEAFSARIDVTQPSDTGWHIMLNQGGLEVQEGQTYAIDFRAKASKPTEISAQVQMNHAPYHPVGPSVKASLGTDWQQFRFEWQPNQGDSNVRLSFLNMVDEVATYWIASPSMAPIGERDREARYAEMPVGFYHPDYRTDFEYGDDPYRYFRW